jgi:hypothetical protein
MDTWIPAFAAKPMPGQRVKIKLACLTETEGHYDFENCQWHYDAKDPLMPQVLAWKKIEGDVNVRSQFSKSAIPEPNGYA